MVGGTSYVHRDSFQNKTNADVGREIDDRLLGRTRAEIKKPIRESNWKTPVFSG